MPKADRPEFQRMNATQTGSALRSGLITAAVIIAALTIMIALLPKGFSDDMSRIGQGTNVAVLIHNKNSVASQHLMELLNRVRPDYVQVEFLVADVDTESGKGFVRAQQLRAVALVLFGPDGTRLSVLNESMDEQGLRTALDSTYELNR